MSALIRKIHVGCRQLGIDAETRHAMQQQLTGKASLSEMSETELLLVVDHLKGKGFAATTGKRPRAKDARLRLIHVLWSKLGQAGALDNPTRAGLNAFIQRRFKEAWGVVPVDIDMLREPLQIDDVVQALKQWGQRVGIDFHWEDHRR